MGCVAGGSDCGETRSENLSMKEVGGPKRASGVFGSSRRTKGVGGGGSVELTTFSTTWLTHTVYETKGVSPYNGWLLRFIGLGLGLGYTGIYII